MRKGNHLSLSRINPDDVRSNVSMHYTFAMRKLKSFQQFFDVISNIITAEFRIQTPEVDVLHVFEGQ